MRITTQLAATLPWVTRLPATQECDGYRWAHVTMKALRDPAILATFKCKQRARWDFNAETLNPRPARSGVYCWSHLLVQLHHQGEQDRFNEWVTVIS